MRRKLLTLFKGLLCASVITGALISCENERPEIIIDDPDPIEPIHYQLVSYTPDTVKFRMRDSIIFNVRTVPYNLLTMDSISLQLTNQDGQPYSYISIGTPQLRRDSIWNIAGYLSKGILDGDIVSLTVTSPDTILHSDPMVLHLLPHEPMSIITLNPDTLTFDENKPALIQIKTTPLDLPSISGMKLELADSTGQVYVPADIDTIMFCDSIWTIRTYFRYGMQDDDVIMVKISDTIEDASVFGKPMVLRMIPLPVPVEYAIDIVSDSISAYTIDNGRAHMRLRTTPWNALLNDTVFHIELTDTAGVPIDTYARIENLEFEPADSCWDAEIKILNIQKSEIHTLAHMVSKDTTVTSPNKFIIKKVTFVLQTVKVNGYSGSFSTNSKSCEICIPAVTDFSSVKLIINKHTGDKVTYNGSELTKDTEYTVNGSPNSITVRVWKFDAYKDYTINLTNTGLPVVRINTSKSVTRRDTWVPGASMTIEMPDGTIDYQGTLSLKGRGNQTWTDFDKKPYALKLDEKSKILGMHKQKRWILLANIKDRTLLRNDLAFWISKQTSLPYTVNGEYVELVWNGKHLGNYYLCEHPRIDDDRIDIHNPNLDEPEKGGFFMGIDAFLDYNDAKWADKGQDQGFWTERYQLPYVFKDPDENADGTMLSKTSKSYIYMYNYVKDMETAISNAQTSDDWMNYLDMSTAVDFALIQEVTMNHDAYNTWPANGPKSTYVYKDSAGLLCFGPIWDFDYHTFTLYNDYEYSGNQQWSNSKNQRLYQWEIMKMTNKGGKYYYSDLKRNAKFKALLLERWNQYKTVWEAGFNDYVDEMASKIKVSWKYNSQMWGCPSKQNGDWNLSFDDAVKAIKDAFKIRMEWIDQNIGNL